MYSGASKKWKQNLKKKGFYHLLLNNITLFKKDKLQELSSYKYENF